MPYTAARRPEMDTGPFAEVIPDYARHKEASLHARSPVRWPERLHKHTPILLLHGSADWRVHPAQPLAMASALYASRHPFRLVFFEGGDHGLSEHREEVRAGQSVARALCAQQKALAQPRTPWAVTRPPSC
jgi:dipeptidyl aminopeptidase/acylaminoacyl peptidase